MNLVQQPKRNTIGAMVQLSVVIVSIFATLFLLFSPGNDKYDYMVILPLCHCFLSIIFFDLFYAVEKSVGRLIVIGGYTIRNVITPLFICLGNYEIATIPSTSQEAILWATLVMVYETAMVFLYLNNYSRKHRVDFTAYNYLGEGKSYLSLYSVISGGITLVMVYSLIAVPAIMDSYKTLWGTDESVMIQVFSSIQDYSAGTLERLLYAFFSMFFSVMQILWSIKLIELVKKLFNQSILSILLSFGVIFLNTLFVSETNAYTIFVIVILGLNVLQMYPKKKKIILVLLGLGAAAILILMITARAETYESTGDNAYAKFATFLNAYFPGVANVAVLHKLRVPSKWVTLYYDFYKGIPLQSLIPPLMDGQRLSDYFNAAINSTTQILPFAGQTVYYLGFFGPVVQVLVVALVMRFEQKARQARDNIEYLAYTTSMVLLAAGCTMYDVTILVAFALKTIVPFIILAKCKKIRVRI